MLNRRRLLTACGVVILGLATAPSTGAVGSPANKMMYLTFNRPVALPGVALGSGTYIFELADPNNAWDVVRVLSRDRSRVYYTGFTQLVNRPAGMRHDQAISFSEAPPTAAQPIKVWWPQDDSMGRQFTYRDQK
jgi:hypothetical protein